jgi:glycogen synthase
MEGAPAPKRILMTADTLGGVWTYALELSQALGEHGIEVALAAMGELLTGPQRKAARKIPNLTVFESDFKLEWMRDPWSDLERAGAWLLRLEEEFRPDLAHLNGFVHGALPWRVPKLVVGHSCVLSWWLAVREKNVPACWDRYREEVSRGLGAADLVVAPSRAMLDSLLYHYEGIRAARVIPNGRTAGLFSCGPKEPFVFAAGRVWDEAKNILALERVAPRLPWPVYVAGGIRHPEGGSVACRCLRLLGPLCQDLLSGWYARASIYALPARYEPYGLTVLEAALAGCALVLGDTRSLRETWSGAAIFVPPDDKKALEDALKFMITSEARRKGYMIRARARALDYSASRMAGAYLEAYRDLMKKNACHKDAEPQ